jgi:hypothetical protein
VDLFTFQWQSFYFPQWKWIVDANCNAHFILQVLFVFSCHCLFFVIKMAFIRIVCAGEEQLSFGFGGTGKASTECQFKDYGEAFTAGDVITAYVVS